MLHACNAVDATGKKRYRKRGVGARFKQVIRDSLDVFGAMAMPGLDLAQTRFPVPVKSDLPDKRPDIADILYEIHRCTHGHGDDLPEGYELMPYTEPVVVTRMHHGKIRLSASAVLGLLAVAVFAPENNGQVIPDSYYLSWRERIFHIFGWWGRQDDFRKIIGPVRSQSASVTINFAHWWDAWAPPGSVMLVTSCDTERVDNADSHGRGSGVITRKTTASAPEEIRTPKPSDP
jgi:hypothetical protein